MRGGGEFMLRKGKGGKEEGEEGKVYVTEAGTRVSSVCCGTVMHWGVDRSFSPSRRGRRCLALPASRRGRRCLGKAANHDGKWSVERGWRGARGGGR